MILKIIAKQNMFTKDICFDEKNVYTIPAPDSFVIQNVYFKTKEGIETSGIYKLVQKSESGTPEYKIFEPTSNECIKDYSLLEQYAISCSFIP